MTASIILGLVIAFALCLISDERSGMKLEEAYYEAMFPPITDEESNPS